MNGLLYPQLETKHQNISSNVVSFALSPKGSKDALK